MIIGAAVVIFLIAAAAIILGIIVFMVRRRGKRRAGAPGGAGTGPAVSKPSMRASRADVPQAPAPSPSYTPPPPRSPVMPEVATAGADHGMTVDLSRTIAITPDGDTSPISYGGIKFVSGVLAGRDFEVKPDGAYVGRDSSLSQIVLADPRISKRHLWIGVKDGNVVITDQGSRNGTFVNDPKSARISETVLKPGDTVILGESDVARFEYHR